jgi:hypothetical protein
MVHPRGGARQLPVERGVEPDVFVNPPGFDLEDHLVAEVGCLGLGVTQRGLGREDLCQGCFELGPELRRHGTDVWFTLVLLQGFHHGLDERRLDRARLGFGDLA